MMKLPPPDNIIEFELPKNTPCERLVSYPDVSLSENQKPLNTLDNLSFLMSSLGYTPAINQMNLEPEILKDGVPLRKSIEARRSILISAASKTRLPKSAIDDHLIALSEDNFFHPVKAWLETGEQWDGVKRIDKFVSCFNAKAPELAYIAISKWLVAAVAALYERNFVCKIVVVLQGEQSQKKSAFISRFAEVVPEAFTDGAELNPDEKDSVLKSIKSWIVELAELETTTRNNQGALKSFFTRKVDSVRPPYGRADIKKKRQTVFIASVNGTGFLRDETGSSRYCVIESNVPLDIESLNKLLGYSFDGGRVVHHSPGLLRQFWLEIKHYYDNGASWVLTDEELKLFNKVNSEHQFKDDMRFLLEDFISDKEKGWIYRWMKATDVCEMLKLQSTKSRQIGRALTVMSKDGLIKTKEGRSNSTLFWLPYALNS